MPETIPHIQKRFKLTITNGQPEAMIESKWAARLIMCCPLCGCMHQVMGVDENLPYTPLCQTLPRLYKAQLVTWHQLYPEITQYKTLLLVEQAASA